MSKYTKIQKNTRLQIQNLTWRSKRGYSLLVSIFNNKSRKKILNKIIDGWQKRFTEKIMGKGLTYL